MALHRHGWPAAWEVFPGHTADIEALEQVISKFRDRFPLGRVVVADRGMMSAKTMELLAGHQDPPFDYVLGCRMRQQKEVTEEVLSRAGRYQEVAPNLGVKEVVAGARRYVVCLNPEEAQRDAADWQAILAKLQETLEERGPKAVIGNRGYARFLKVSPGGSHPQSPGHRGGGAPGWQVCAHHQHGSSPLGGSQEL